MTRRALTSERRVVQRSLRARPPGQNDGGEVSTSKGVATVYMRVVLARMAATLKRARSSPLGVSSSASGVDDRAEALKDKG